MKFVLVVLATVAVSGVALAADQRPIHPKFTPQGSLDQYYPSRAMDLGKTGWARVRCQIGVTGSGENCLVLNEFPRGFGFGKAAVIVFTRGKFETTYLGQSVIGRTVDEKIPFMLSGSIALPTKSYEFVSEPTPQEVQATHPKGPEDFGMADIACQTVAADGALSNCRVHMESPTGAGFGAAALKLADRYRLRDPSPPMLTAHFNFNWNGPGGDAVSSMMSDPLDFDQAGTAGAFEAGPTKAQLKAAAPADLTAPASARVDCKLSIAGGSTQCSTELGATTDARYKAAAMSLLGSFRLSQAFLARLQNEPRAMYRVNWER